MKAVIIAAGKSSRLWSITDKRPKTLLPFRSGTILSTILNNLASAGCTEFVMVLGFEADKILSYLTDNDLFGHKIEFIVNPEYHRGNGISVYLAKDLVNNENFILSMSDHIVSTKAIRRVIASSEERNILLVDKKIAEVFDIDDATKVNFRNDSILEINKDLEVYNGIDCGIFRLNNRFFEAMGKQIDAGEESISAGVKNLIEQGDMASVFLNEDEYWLDIDTPEAYEHIQTTNTKFNF
ncbi:NTP transferase domain-containing protein [bacterium]|nr:NTP transferase domain-containing protein [bacterium]